MYKVGYWEDNFFQETHEYDNYGEALYRAALENQIGERKYVVRRA